MIFLGYLIQVLLIAVPVIVLWTAIVFAVAYIGIMVDDWKEFLSFYKWATLAVGGASFVIWLIWLFGVNADNIWRWAETLKGRV